MDCPENGLPNYSLNEESLPEYEPTIYHIGIVMILSEQVVPYKTNRTSKWLPVISELNSTQLNFYRFCEPLQERFVELFFKNSSRSTLERFLDPKYLFKEQWGYSSMRKRPLVPYQEFFSRSSNCELFRMLNSFPKLSPRRIIEDQNPHNYEKFRSKALKGELVRSFTLQNCEVGSAAESSKREFVLRIRLENELFNFQTPNFKEYLNWYDKIRTGSKLAQPLDMTSVYHELSSLPRMVGHTSVIRVLADLSLEYLSAEGKDTSIMFPARSRNSSKHSLALNDHTIRNLVHLIEDLNIQQQRDYLQLVCMSRCILPLLLRDEGVRNPVVIHEKSGRSEQNNFLRDKPHSRTVSSMSTKGVGVSFKRMISNCSRSKVYSS